MTCINDVRLQGKLLKAPEFAETSTKKRYARLILETEEFYRVNGESKRVAQSHQVTVYNQFSLPALQDARAGSYVTVSGKLAYDRSGKAVVEVSQYNGEAKIVSFPGMAAIESPAADATQQERPASTPRSSGGGLGRLGGLPKGRDGESDDPREAEGARTPSTASKRDDELDDDIPF